MGSIRLQAGIRMMLLELLPAHIRHINKYDCSKVNHGGLVLDTRAKHVFVYP